MATTPATTKQAERLILAVEKIMRRLHGGLSSVWERRKLTKPQLITLNCVMRKRECTMSELARMTSMALSALTGIIDRLSAKGLVRRERNGEDRRVVKVLATEKGAAIATEYQQAYLQCIDQVFSRIAPAEREALVSLIEKIAGSFEPGEGRAR